MSKTERMIITISFKDKSDYFFVKNHPNSSYYIRELVKKDRKKQNEKVANLQPENDLKNEIRNVLGVF